MSDFIKREDVKEAVSEALSALEDFWNDNEIREYDVYSELYDLISGIANVPAAEQELPKGKWSFESDCGITRCEACGWSIEENFYNHSTNNPYDYCPNCGAEMGVEV